MADIVDTHKLVLLYVQMTDFYTSLPYRSTLEDLIVPAAARHDGREHGGRGHGGAAACLWQRWWRRRSVWRVRALWQVGSWRCGGRSARRGKVAGWAFACDAPVGALSPPNMVHAQILRAAHRSP